MKQLVFAAPAEKDLDSIVDFIVLDDPAAAERVFRDIVSAARRLVDFPEMGRLGRAPQTREFSVTSLPYVIVYEVERDTITVLAVFHGARDLARPFADRKRELRPGGRKARR